MFHLFPKLPTEIRLRIWKLALCGPRILGLVLAHDMLSELSDPNEPIRPRIEVNHPPDVLLHVNRESREEALRKYTLRLSTVDTESHDWIDPINDTLLLEYSSDYIYENYCITQDLELYGHYISVELRGQLQKLAIDELLWSTCDQIKSLLESFSGLKEFTLVTHGDNCLEKWKMSHSDISFIDPDDAESKDEQNATLDSLEKTVQGFKDSKTGQPLLGIRAIPELRVKFMRRGGQRCCSYECGLVPVLYSALASEK